MSVRFSNGSVPTNNVDPSLPKSVVSATSNKTPGASVVAPTKVEDATATSGNRKGLIKTVIPVSKSDPIPNISESSATDLHKELNPGSKEVPTTNAERLIKDTKKPGNKRVERVLAARAASGITGLVTKGAVATKNARVGAVISKNASVGVDAPVDSDPSAPSLTELPASPEPSSPPAADVKKIDFNKGICTLLSFGPYDKPICEYINLEAINEIKITDKLKTGTFETTEFNFLKQALGQNELIKYYKITNKAEIEVLQNVFGVNSIGKKPYFFENKNCKFDGIEVVIKAINNRIATMNEQIAAISSETLEKKRLSEQLKWFNETATSLKKTQTSGKACPNKPKCEMKIASSLGSLGSLGSFGSFGLFGKSGKSGDCPCLTEINALYDLLLLIDYLSGKGKKGLKEYLEGKTFQELLQIATNKNSKEDMTGHIKVVLGELLKFYTTVNSSNSSLNNDTLFNLYNMFEYEKDPSITKDNITLDVFKSLIVKINGKLKECLEKDKKLAELIAQVEKLKAEGEPGGSNAERDELAGRIDTAVRQLEAMKSNRDDIYKEFEGLRADCANQREMKDRAWDDLERVTGELDELRLIHNAMAAGRGNPSEETTRLRADIGKLTAEKATALTDLAEAQGSLRETQTALTNTQGQLNNIIVRLRADLASATAEITRLQSQRDTGDGKIIRDEPASDLDVKLADLEAKNAKTLAELTEAQTKLTEVNGELETLRDQTSKTINDLRADLASEKAKTAELEARITSSLEGVEATKVDVSKAEGAVKGLRGRNKINGDTELARLRDKLDLQNTILQNFRTLYGANGETITALQDLIDKANDDLIDVRNNLDAATSSLSDLQKSHLDKDRLVNEFLDEISQLERDVNGLGGSVGPVGPDVPVNNDLENAQGRLELLSQELEKLRSGNREEVERLVGIEKGKTEELRAQLAQCESSKAAELAAKDQELRDALERADKESERAEALAKAVTESAEAAKKVEETKTGDEDAHLAAIAAATAAANAAVIAADEARDAALAQVDTIRAESEAASAAAKAAAEASAAEITKLKDDFAATLHDLQENLDLCRAQLEEKEEGGHDISGLLNKTKALVALGDDDAVCVETLNKLIDAHLNSGSFKGLPEDIFTIYDGYKQEDYDKKSLYEHIGKVLVQALEKILTDKKSIELNLEIGVLHKLRSKITGVKKPLPNISFLNTNLTDYSFSSSTEPAQLVKGVAFNEPKNIPIGILAIKFFQLCKELGGAGAGEEEAPVPPKNESNENGSKRKTRKRKN